VGTPVDTTVAGTGLKRE
jgi:hypothetical protein